MEMDHNFPLQRSFTEPVVVSKKAADLLNAPDRAEHDACTGSQGTRSVFASDA